MYDTVFINVRFVPLERPYGTGMTRHVCNIGHRCPNCTNFGIEIVRPPVYYLDIKIKKERSSKYETTYLYSRER